jgi:hypothetical protein
MTLRVVVDFEKLGPDIEKCDRSRNAAYPADGGVCNTIEHALQ